MGRNVHCVDDNGDDATNIKNDEQNWLIDSRTSATNAGNSGSKIPFLCYDLGAS